MTTPRQLLGQARVHTFEYVPYLASYIYSLRERETPGIRTAAVDAHGTLYWDPEYIKSLGKETGAYLITHEVLHLLFDHHARAQEIYGTKPSETQQYIMNVAADLVIEQTLASMRHIRPKGAVHLGAHVPKLGIKLNFPENRSMQEYYRLICERLKNASQDEDESGPQAGDQDDPEEGLGQSDGNSDGEGESEGEAGGQGEAPPEGSSAPPEGAAGGGAPPPSEQPTGPQGRAGEPGAGGSCADGVERGYEEEPDGAWEAYGADFAASAAEQAIAEFEHSNPGKVPGNIKDALKLKLRPQPDPFDQLRSAVCSSVAAPIGGRDFSRRRRSRKQPQGDDQPLLHGRICTQPKAVVIVDTSGSMMGRETQAKALAVIAQGLRKLARVKVYCADTHVRSHALVTNTTRFEWAGGGGTDMSKALAEVDKAERPDSIILITDAQTNWEEKLPRARVVVAFTGKDGDQWRPRIPAPFRVVTLQP